MNISKRCAIFGSALFGMYKSKLLDLRLGEQVDLLIEDQDMRVVKYTDLRFRGRIIKSGLGTRGV
jgi:tRNA splicing endonuclease